MANNVRMSNAIQKFIAESKCAFFEGLIEAMQSALNEMQTINSEPITAPMAVSGKAGFMIEVAVVVGIAGQFREFHTLLTGKSPDDLSLAFHHKGHTFWRVMSTEIHSISFDKVICLDPYFDPVLTEVIQGLIDDKEEISMMTPMELIRLINQPV